MDNEFILQDRIQKISQIINQYGEENFYLSFSGGKDSTVLSHLVDMALPDNQIPRVYCDTGIELIMVHNFVVENAIQDKRIHIIKPTLNIRDTLNAYGYPFKSKEHSLYLNIYQRHGYTKSVKRYLQPEEKRKPYGCPKMLTYQFNNNFDLRISNKCCNKLKKEPLHKWQKENNKPYMLTGIMASEKGLRSSAKCLVFTNNKLKSFQPLAPLTKEWEEWFIKEYNIDICDIYKPPYNFKRTGCKGCPYNPNLQKDLDTLEEFFPNERKQCELIWKPVYDEYRRLHYRLKEEKK